MGSYNLLINGVCWGYNPLILAIDPNFLGHPSREGMELHQRRPRLKAGGFSGGSKLYVLDLQKAMKVPCT